MRHPRTYSAWEWDKGNVPKLALRGIRQVDIEAVGHNRPEWKPNKRSGTATWAMVGRDNGGRLLRVNVLWADERSGRLRAIGGWVVPARRGGRR